MSWLLALLAAGGAIYFLVQAHRRAKSDFRDAMKKAERKRHAPSGQSTDRKV
ncbi:hypothetical protein [Desulfobaculum senezii]|jgi:hypothetical protein